LGLEPGSAVVLSVVDHELRIVSLRESIRRSQDIVRKAVPHGTRLSDELLAERRREVARDRDRR
jgi:hypothetical protein